MDERTRRTDGDLAPEVRRRPPASEVTTQSRSKFRIGPLLVALLAAFAADRTLQWVSSSSPSGGRFPQGGAQTVGASTVVLGNIRVIVNALGTVTPLGTV